MEVNQQTTRIATCYPTKYLVAPTAQRDLLPIVHVIHDLINEHSGGRRHHSLS